MALKRQSRLAYTIVTGLTTLVLLIAAGAISYLSTVYYTRADWSENSRNTLSEQSVAVLAAMPGPIRVTVYTRAEGVPGRVIKELLDRYARERDDFETAFVNPDVEPERVRALGVTRDGELDIEYKGRRQRIERPAERTITNALMQLARAEARWVAHLSGHGERSLDGQANHDLGNFGVQLAERGFKLQSLNLAETITVPTNIAVLVIAGPRVDLLPAEQAALKDYLARGGNVLWLVDPGGTFGMNWLADALSLKREAGTIIDPATRGFIKAGLGNPTFALISRYGKHAALSGFNLLTVLPGAGPLSVTTTDTTKADWTPSALLQTGDRVWAELGKLAGTISQDLKTEASGPFNIGLAFERPTPDSDGTQRVVVISDGDFLSNSALGNGGNLDLGIRLVNWLARDDQLVDIPVRSDPDLKLDLSPTLTAVIGLGWLIGVPAILSIIGGTFWLRRRHR